MFKSMANSSTGIKFACTVLIANFSMALFFLLLSWAIGGDTYFEDVLFGEYAVPFLLLGIVAAVVLRMLLGAQTRVPVWRDSP